LEHTTEHQVILVDEQDREIGLMEKHEAHRKGALHRAFSVFIFNSQGELLLQRRAFGKYHSEGLWTNTCCSHPNPEEDIIAAGNRRLHEEMGLTCELRASFSFIYKAELDNGFTEFELDHVLIGHSDETPHLNTNEAMSFKWMKLDELKRSADEHPAMYTEWFKIILNEHLSKLSLALTHESL
jgi:isopentenyl-diphosphate delta-isomerase